MILRLLLLFLSLFALAISGHSASKYEEEIISSMEEIKAANITDSITRIKKLLKYYPNSKLGYLMLADLLSSRGSGKVIQQFSDNLGQVNGLRDEIKYRWRYYHDLSSALSSLIPSNLIQVSVNQKYIIIVDASYARLYIYENTQSRYRFIDSYFMTVGKEGMDKHKAGDLRTPIGVYFVTSYISGDILPSRYGAGAFPIDYPNELDKINKKTGYGIWIHGTELENYNRVPLASDGCISLSNDEFLEIEQYIKTDGSTPVIISDKLIWTDNKSIMQSRKEFKSLIENWKIDWESLNINKYLSHYSKENFQSGKHDFESWAKHKTQANSLTNYIKITLNELSIYSYPSLDREILMVSFNQNYQSNTDQSSSEKKQFWEKNSQGKWKIIYEN